MSTDVTTQTLVGISISPHSLSAAVVSPESFSLLESVETFLPENVLSADGQRILDLNELIQLLVSFKHQLNLDDTHPIPTYLSIVPAIMDTQQVESRQPNAIRHELEQLVLMPDIFQQGVLKDPDPVLQHTTMGQSEDEVLVGYGLAGSQLIRDYEEAFSRAGFQLKSIDLLPLCLLRAMAASGVLDALIQKIGPKGIWGCFGTVGSKTWITLWQGRDLLEMGSFITPKSKQAWRNRILTVLELAGVEEPELWFSWQEPGSLVPTTPSKLELKAPVKHAFLGPLYHSAATKPALFPALGAALKADISFPLNWEFLIQRIPDAPDRASQSHNPQTTRLVPKLMWGSIGLFLSLIVLSGFLWHQNREHAQVTQLQNDQVKATLSVMTRNNPLYSQVLNVINQVSRPGLQLEEIRLKDSDTLILSGKAPQKAHIDQFIQRLNTVMAQNKVHLSAIASSTNVLSGKPKLYAFEYRAAVTSESPQPAGETP